MKSILRQRFLDRTWDAEHLDDAAMFWLQLYDIAAPYYGYAATPWYDLEIYLSGFPCCVADALRTELENGAERGGFPESVVTLADDTLVLSSARLAPPQAPPAGLGLPLLSGPGFEGLAVELRFRITCRARFMGGRTYLTLAIAGEIRDGALLVKAVWRSHYTWDQDGGYRFPAMVQELKWFQVMPQDLELVLAIDHFRRFRKAGAVTPNKLALLDPLTFWDSIRLRRHLILNTPFDRPRVRGLLVRLGVFAGMTAVWLLFMYLVAKDKRWSLPAFLSLIFGPILLFQFAYIELGWLLTYWSRRSEVGKQYETPARYRIRFVPDESPARTNDPAVRKYTGDLLAGGFVFLGDVVHQSALDFNIGYRIFGAPDGVTYLVVFFYRHCYWPAVVTLQAQTFFQGGGRVDSLAGAGHGFERFATGPGILHRVFPPTTDPIQFYQAHLAAVEKFAAREGLSPARHERMEDYVLRQERISEEDCQFYHNHPYSWWDHLRWYLQWPRRERRG